MTALKKTLQDFGALQAGIYKYSRMVAGSKRPHSDEDVLPADDGQDEECDIDLPLDLATSTGSGDGGGDPETTPRPGGEDAIAEGVPKSRVVAGSKRPHSDEDVLPEEVGQEVAKKRKKPKLSVRWCPVRSCRAKPQTKLSNHLFQQHSYLTPSQHQAALRQAKVYWRPPKKSKAERQQLQGAPLADLITSFFKRTAEESTFSCVCVCVCMCVRVCHN